MTLEFLGVGSAFAKDHFQNNLLINGNILIDCGASVGHSLRDTGRSFEDIDHIFNPDYTTKEKGLGLGLPIAHEIISAHGGVLRAHSHPGPGTTFEVLLPWERKI